MSGFPWLFDAEALGTRLAKGGIASPNPRKEFGMKWQGGFGLSDSSAD
jgi:hypothetical protein